MSYGSPIQALPTISYRINCIDNPAEELNLIPIGPLMWEHRLIERLVGLMSTELDHMSENNSLDPFFIDTAEDFLRTYADRCHHGKEEGILFRNLARKNLSSEHEKMMRELVEEHAYARMTIARLSAAKEAYLAGNADSLGDATWLLKELVRFYPAHIDKEDKLFFQPCMEYFTAQERDVMLQEFWDFDRKLIHEKYQQLVEKIDKKR